MVSPKGVFLLQYFSSPTQMTSRSQPKPEAASMRTILPSQPRPFEKLENRLEEALVSTSYYYTANHLTANVSKTQTYVFHQHNREAERQLKITWINENLEYANYPVYLGVTLDRTLNYKEHIRKTKAKLILETPSLANLLSLDGGQTPRL